MQVGGKPVARYTGTVHILRPTGETDEQGNPAFADLQFKVKQLHTSWAAEAERQLPPPEPPINGSRYENGREITKYDEKDPKYRAALLDWEQMMRAKKIHDATIDDRIEWETDEALLESDPKAFYRSIWQELSDSFSAQELARWDLTIVSIDAVGGADIALAEESLFRAILRRSEVSVVEGDADGEQPGTEPAVP